MPDNFDEAQRRQFIDVLTNFRNAAGLSQRQLAERANCDRSLVTKAENGTRVPSIEIVEALDRALHAGGTLVAVIPMPATKPRQTEQLPWDTAELVQRMRRSDVGAETLEGLQRTVERLNCQYAYRDARDLHAEARQWLGRVARIFDDAGHISLRAHTELLVQAGWLTLLASNLEADLGAASTAETTRGEAQAIGDETGHGEIIGWAHELAAWAALTDDDLPRAVRLARAGQERIGNSPAAMQLVAQEAKALARIGETEELRRTLDRGAEIVSRMPTPEHRDNHFTPDGGKWDFHSMDAYRAAGLDDEAVRHAHRVLDMTGAPPGARRSAMRDSEAHLTLGIAAVRVGDLDQALVEGKAALRAGSRRSLPSLIMVGRELGEALAVRYPRELITRQWGEQVRAIATGAA